MATSDKENAAATGKGRFFTRKRLFRFCVLPLLVLLALVLLAAGAVGFAVGTKPGLQTVAWLANHLSGGLVALNSAEGALSSDFTLRGLRFTGGGTEIKLDELHLDWQPTALMHKKLPVRDLQVKGLHLHLPVSEGTEEAEMSPEPMKMPAISLPVAIRVERVRLADFRIFSGRDEVFDLTTAEADGLDAAGENIAFERLAAKNGWMDVTAKGKVAMRDDWPLAVELAYGFDFEGYGPIRGSAAVEGDFAKTVIKTATTEPQAVALEGTATDILNELRWQAKVKSAELALNAINGDWPELNFDAVAISGTGDIQSYDLDVTGNMRTPYTRRPLALAGKTQIGWDGLKVPALRVTDTATGGGHLDLVGSLDWSPQLAWDAVIDLDKLNPDLAHEELPGALSGKISAKGSLPDAGVEAEVALSGISGELRGYPVAADGELAYGGGKLNLPGLIAAVGRNTVEAKGELAEQYALDFRLDAPDLKELLPELDGNLRAEGRLAGAKAAPEIFLDLRGEGVAYAEHRIGRLEGRARGVLSETGALEADIRAEAVALGQTPIDALEARLQGNMANHVLRLSAQAPEDQAAGLELAGGLADGAWSGELRQLQLAHPLAGAWQQGEAAKLAASAQAAKLEPLCLRQDGAEICLNGAWQAEDGAWQGAADIKDMPLAQVQKYLPPDMKLGGSLNLTATAQGKAAQLLDAALNLTTPGLRLDFMHGETAGQSLVWEAHELAATYRGERLLADWRHALAGGSSLDLNLEAPKLPLTGDPMQAPIAGRLRLDFKQLDVLTALTRQQSQWSGAFKGDVAISGSLGKPTLSGNLGLEDGEILIPELGLHIAPLTLAMGGAAGRIDAAVTAHTGRGELRAAGGIDLSGVEGVGRIVAPVVGASGNIGIDLIGFDEIAAVRNLVGVAIDGLPGGRVGNPDGGAGGAKGAKMRELHRATSITDGRTIGSLGGGTVGDISESGEVEAVGLKIAVRCVDPFQVLAAVAQQATLVHVRAPVLLAVARAVEELAALALVGVEIAHEGSGATIGPVARPGFGGVHVGGHRVVVVLVRIDFVHQHQLLEVVHAGDGAGFLAGLGQGGQQHGGQDGDDRNHHQQFNQGEVLFHVLSLSFCLCQKSVIYIILGKIYGKSIGNAQKTVFWRIFFSPGACSPRS